jgi:hypothetical protein
VVYVHLSAEALTAGAGVARVEDVGPVLLSRLHSLLGNLCSINLKPVIDLPAGHTPIDAYEIPASLREQLLLRNPADVFPYAAAVTRSIDIDHTIPYRHPDRGGDGELSRPPIHGVGLSSGSAPGGAAAGGRPSRRSQTYAG